MPKPSQPAVSLSLERHHDQNQPETPTPAPGSLSGRSGCWGLTLSHVDKGLYSQAAGVASSLFALLLSLSISLSLVTVKRHRGCDCHLCRQSVRLPKPISSFLRIIYPEPLLLSLCVPPAPQDGAQQGREGTMGPGERPRKGGSWVPCHCVGPRRGTSAPRDS